MLISASDWTKPVLSLLQRHLQNCTWEINQIKGQKVKIYLTPLSIWRYRVFHAKKLKDSCVCSKICTRKFERSAVDQTMADTSVNTAFKKSSQRKKVILIPDLEKFLAKEVTMLNPQIIKHPSTACGNYSAIILLLQQRWCMAFQIFGSSQRLLF